MTTNTPEWDDEKQTYVYPPATTSAVGVNGRGVRRAGRTQTGGVFGNRSTTSGTDVSNQASQTQKP